MEGDCHQILAELATYLDGECDRGLQSYIGRHLAECPRCFDRADFERHIRTLVATRCRDAAPSGLIDRVMQSLRQDVS